MSDWHAEAQRLYGELGSYKEVGLRLGRTPNSVWKAINHERVSAWNRADWDSGAGKARRRAAADRARATCTDCGKTLSVGSAWRGVARCTPCYHEHRRVLARTVERREQIVAWWAEGLQIREIARRLDRTISYVGVDIARMRELGYDLPYRYKPGPCWKPKHEELAA